MAPQTCSVWSHGPWLVLYLSPDVGYLWARVMTLDEAALFIWEQVLEENSPDTLAAWAVGASVLQRPRFSLHCDL